MKMKGRDISLGFDVLSLGDGSFIVRADGMG
jgi:hypothetical protein